MLETQTKPIHFSPVDDIQLWNVGIDAIVKLGDFPSREAVVAKAMQLFFQAYPQQRLEMAVQLYRDDEVTLSRAAEIANLNFLDFQAILQARGIEMPAAIETKEEINRGVASVFGNS